MSTGLDRVWDIHMRDANAGWRRARCGTCDALWFVAGLVVAAGLAFLAVRAAGGMLGWLIHLGQHWTEVPL